MSKTSCKHVWGQEYTQYENDNELYSKHDLHQAIIDCEIPGGRFGADCVYINEYCPDCGERLVPDEENICDHTLGLACYNDKIDKEIKSDNQHTVEIEYAEYPAEIDWFKFCPRCGEKNEI